MRERDETKIERTVNMLAKNYIYIYIYTYIYIYIHIEYMSIDR